MASEFYLLLCDLLASDQLDLLWRAIKCLSHLVKLQSAGGIRGVIKEIDIFQMT